MLVKVFSKSLASRSSAKRSCKAVPPLPAVLF